MIGQQKGSQQESADGPEGAHAVHEPDVDRGWISFHVIVDVGRAQREEGRTTAAEQKLGHHEDENWKGRGFSSLQNNFNNNNSFFPMKINWDKLYLKILSLLLL